MAYEVIPCAMLTPVRKENGRWLEERVPMFQVREDETGWETLGVYTTQEAAEKVKAELELTRPCEVHNKITLDTKRLSMSRRQQKRQEIADLKKEIREQSGK